MSVLPILKWPDSRLSQLCAPVPPSVDLAGVIADLFETMYAAQGRGLAAPQVGILQRFFVMDCDWKEQAPAPKVCINPKILYASDETSARPEGCLSLPGITADVTRPVRIILLSYDLAGQQQRWHLNGFAATCAQHELDHLNGLVTFDRVDPADRQPLEACYGAAMI